MESLENHNLSHRSSSSVSHIPAEPIKVRCPECLKLYAVDPTEIKMARPKFECVACKTRFWLAYPESVYQGEIIGFPLEWLESPSKPKSQTDNASWQPKSDTYYDEAKNEASSSVRKVPCPKCQKPYPVGDKECRSCGLVFAKYEALQSEDVSVYASPELKAAWEEVILDYENLSLHQRFLHLCQKEDNLEYAANKYRRLLEAAPMDEMARKMKDAVMALSSVPLTTTKTEVKKRTRIPFFAIMVFLSATIMVTGYLVPQLRNLVGFGASIMFLSLAFRFYFGR